MIDKEKFRDNFKYFDKGTIVQVIDMFLEEYLDRFAELQENINNLDFVAIDNNAHSFKSNVVYMSAEMGELARILEHKGKDQDSGDLQPLFDQLKAGTILLVAELPEMRKEYE
jgi:HPt (histidine-containing phosphotransfer) domain-containing protein